uniref:J domain-containing protein n=1 Tax=Auxenochlorella protothecoides TaxID=3075 RepID=A0A1D1ZYA6_AUXPR
MGRSRSRSRSPRRTHRSRSRSADRYRHRSSREKDCDEEADKRKYAGSTPAQHQHQSTGGTAASSDAEKKAARLAKLQAWKLQQAGGVSSAQHPAPPVTMAVHQAHPISPPTALPLPAQGGGQRDEDEVDPLDAFMAAEVLPEVAAREAEEKKRAEDERAKLKELLAKGKLPKALEELIQDDQEETPDEIIEIPSNKVKLVVGPAGEKIKFIQRKSKCRIQHAKEEQELEVGFGMGPLYNLPIKTNDPNAPPKMTKLLLFGDSTAVEAARVLIMEAIDNREQKVKQRQKEYDKKKDAKRLQRQLYHMRHALDYETLGLPLGASKADCKAAYRKLALQWHPDKNMDRREEAEKMFQNISKAYESLMSTDEDATIQQLAH